MFSSRGECNDIRGDDFVVASPAAGGAIATIYGFETLFVIAGLVIAAGLIPTLLSPETTPPRPETTESNLATGLTEMLRRHRHDLLTAGSGPVSYTHLTLPTILLV